MIGELPITLIFGGTKAPKSLTINADPGILAEGEVIKIERHIDKYVIKSKQMVIDADWQKISGHQSRAPRYGSIIASVQPLIKRLASSTSCNLTKHNTTYSIRFSHLDLLFCAGK